MVIVAPNPLINSDPSLFLAGGITGCPDWQSDAIELLVDLPMTLLNPRRPDFDITDPLATGIQIGWEHRALRAADAILFWFCQETIQPITLYELGAWSMKSSKPVFVGVHPQYERRIDVEIQTSLVRPEIDVQLSLEALCLRVKDWWASPRTHRKVPKTVDELLHSGHICERCGQPMKRKSNPHGGDSWYYQCENGHELWIGK
jgi:hypothetical protein